MKTFLPALAAVLISTASFSQTIPELIFRDPVHVTGTPAPGLDGAKYRFSNVATGIDAIVEIKGRSDVDVVLGCIDSTGIGWDKAFQPILGIPDVGANREWWIEFRMEFVNAGTTNQKKLDKFFATGFDIDGDSGNLNEWAEMRKANKLNLAVNSTLDTSLLALLPDPETVSGDKDYRITGPITNYVNIDTSGLQVMAGYEFKNKKKIDFKIGGNTNAIGGATSLRMNSIWFKEFDLTPPVILGVKLVSFTAMLNNNSKVDLKWSTATETNLNYYMIERSTDGTNFSDAGMVFAYGNTTSKSDYAFADNISNIQSVIVYYRLRDVNMDGKSFYSAIRIIRLDKQAANNITILTYPNPASNEVRITIPNNWQNKKVVYELFSANGQPAKKIETTRSNQTEILNVSNLITGLYIVKVTCEGKTAQQKIVKQ